MDNQLRSKKITILGITIFGLIIIISVVGIIVRTLTKNDHKVVVANIASCAERISEYSKGYVGEKLYNVVNTQTEIDGVPSLKTYYATIDEASCSTWENRTRGVISINDYNFTYMIEFDWFTTSLPEGYQRTPIVDVYCLPNSNFACEDNPLTKPMDELPDYIYYLPLQHDGYRIIPTVSNLSSSGYAVVVELNPPDSVYESGTVSEFTNQKITEAKELLKTYGLNPDDYEFLKKYKILR